jgi:hypothetical protein
MNVWAMLLMGLMLGTTVGAESAQEPVEDILSPARWEIAPEISYFQYEEFDTMKDKGFFYGVSGAYTRYHRRHLFRVEGSFAFGLVDYEGALDDGTPYTMNGSRDFLLGLRLLWGRPWEAQEWDNLFYGGLGYRGLNDNSTQDPSGYDRQSNYFYLPLGLKAYRTLDGRWMLGVGAEFDILLLGLQFSGIYDNGVLTNVQWLGVGARFSVELRHRGESADLALAPFFQYWWVDDSNVSSDGWYEPRNQSFQYGLSLIWRF